jgi:arylsulfatase A-like enzyme
MTSRWVRDHSIGHRNGSTRLTNEAVTLATIFSEASYDTAAFVSNPLLQRRVGLDLGFGHYDDDMTEVDSNHDDAFERLAEQTTDRAVHWLTGLRGAAYFLWVHYNDPHGPYTPPEPYLNDFAPDAVADEKALPVLSIDRGWFGIPAYQELPGLRRVSEYRSRYSGEIRYFDAEFARLLKAAERSAAPRGLVVLVTSDHGESFGERNFYFSHGYATTPDLAHVPMLLRAPGIEPGRRTELVHHVDILPTLLETAGLPAPAKTSGIALGAALRGEIPFPDRTVFCDVGAEVGAYRGDLYLRARLGASLGDTRKGDWSAHRWGRDGLDPAPAAEALRGAIEDYSRDSTAMNAAAELTGDEAERLRALGYLGPESVDGE